MIRNVDTTQTKFRKGNGGEYSAPHHRNTVNGKQVSRIKDGCKKCSSCENCTIPVEKCSGDY